MANVNTLLQHAIVQRRRMSRYAVDDDMSDSSESNSSSDDSSISDIDDNFDTMNVIVRPAIQQVLVYGSFIYGKIEDESINFNQRRTIQDFTCSECVSDFRFRKEHLQDLSHKLWPRLSPFLGDNRDHLILQNRYTAPFETCLLVYLFKMARPVRLRPDCERKFGMRKSHLSVIVQCFGNALFSLSQQYLFNPDIWHHRMAYYGELVALKCGHIFTNIWGFIDGTIRRTCCPILHQELLYTRYKRCHGLKFQSIVTPDGYVACLYGPFVAKRHDSRMYRESGVREELQTIMPEDQSNGPVYALYGDLAYPQSIWLLGGFVNPARDSPEALFNQTMSASRIAVEWGFNHITLKWRHVDCTKSMQVFKQPIAQQYINCAFLTNLINCYYGSQTSKYFGGRPMDVDAYLALIDGNPQQA
jgi:nuclease HARBI1